MEDKGKFSRGCPQIVKDDPNISPCRKGSSCKLNVTDWLEDLPTGINETDIVEIRFKNTRKGYYRNVNSLDLEKGDLVAVESSPGHDIGVVSLTGELVKIQLAKNNQQAKAEYPKIYRKAKPNDIEKWEEAISLEDATMFATRKITSDLKLDMKIGDVEYQGDKTKAIFYYIADGRVDFRELIRVLADRFRIRIEMRQIGARQEAGRIGGIGPCGRELCCSTFITNFVSVTTNSARYQELSLNPQKLAGQCGKLKCCLNYEMDSYIDAREKLPSRNVQLKTENGTAYHFKTDVFRGIMWYSFDKDMAVNVTPIPVEKVHNIIKRNKKGEHDVSIAALKVDPKEKELGYENVVGEDSLTRFDEQKKKKKRRKGNRNYKKRPPKNDNSRKQ